MTKASEIRVLNDEELVARVAEFKQELFNLRFQNATGQLTNSARVTAVRREIARANSVLREREIEAAEKLEADNG